MFDLYFVNPQVERLRSEVEKEMVRREEMAKLCEEKAAARERELKKEMTLQMEVQRKEMEVREVESRKEMALLNEKAKVREAEIRGEVEGLLLNFITEGVYEGLRELVGSKLRNDLGEQTQK